MKPSIANIRALSKTIKIYNTISRCYKLSITVPENVNWNMDMEEYNTHMKILENVMKHPYLVNKSEIHPSNKSN